MVKHTKIGNHEMCKMANIHTKNNPFTLKLRPLRAIAMSKRMRLFSGAEGMYQTHPQQWQ
jgi:hypothetical protein